MGHMIRLMHQLEFEVLHPVFYGPDVPTPVADGTPNYDAVILV